MEDLNRKLAEKVEEIQDIEDLNQTLIMRDHMSNQELQDLRKELINVSLPFLCSAIMDFGLPNYLFMEMLKL